MSNVRIGKAEAPRIAAAAVAVLCAHLACSLESLGHLTNGERDAANGRDGNGGGDIGQRAEVVAAADTRFGVGGSTGAEPEGGATGASDAESISAAGGAMALGGSSGSVTDSSNWVGAGGAAVTGSGGIAEAGGAAGQAMGGSGTGGLGMGGSETGGSLGPDAGSDTSQSPDGQTADEPSVRKTALLVAATVPLVGGDAVVRARLQSKGFDVSVVKDSAVATATIDTNLVLIARGSWSLNVKTKFRTAAVPVLVCEPSVYVDMGMVDRTLGSWGTTSATSLIVNPLAASLAAGLSGPAAMVSTTTEEMNYGIPSASAIFVATVLDKPTYWPVFAYDSSATMFGLDAPARRGGFFFSKTAPNALTHEGWQLFEAMVDWLTQ